MRANARNEYSYKIIDQHVHKDKIARFSNVIVGYNNKIVKHVGIKDDYMLLEREMTTYTGDKGQKSPNRLDALTLGLKYHLDSLKKPQFKANLNLHVPKKEITPHDFL